MKILVELVGVLQGRSAKRIREIELNEEMKVRPLIRELLRMHAPFMDKENIEANLLVLINGKEIGLIDGLETTLNPGDRVTLIPISHGG